MVPSSSQKSRGPGWFGPFGGRFVPETLMAPIEELEKLWTAVEREKAHVAIGSRAVDRSLVGVHQPRAREMMGRFFNLMMRAVTGLPFHDTQCGFKLFEGKTAREVFSRQKLEGFGFDVEVLYIALQRYYIRGLTSGVVKG